MNATVAAMSPSRPGKPNRKLSGLRASLGLSQRQMAEKLGVTLRMYQYYEAGAVIPKPVLKLLELIQTGRY